MINYKKDFPFFDKTSSKLIYFDSAATTQRLGVALEAMSNYYIDYNASVHRTVYALGEKATIEYEQVRDLIAQFINAGSSEEIIFTSGTTDSLNKLALGLEHYLCSGDEIVVTVLEHHSNFIPWQQLAQRTGAIFKVIQLQADGLLDCSGLEKIITDRTKIVALAHRSNVIGTSLDQFKTLLRRARIVGALTVIDGAQAIGYELVDVQDLDVDFYAFSGHKMAAPTGIGILYAHKRVHKIFKPMFYGGGAIASVTLTETQFAKSPYCYEPGTPAIAQVIGLGAVIKYLQTVGMKHIDNYTNKLVRYFLDSIKNIKTIKVVGNKELLYESGHLVSFMVEGMHAHDVAAYLDSHGICVRAGHHCAQPLMQVFGYQAAVRISFYIYNTQEEVDTLIALLAQLA